tara:strand:- start:1146 stop:2009 length:864 start_codon:yes stop_codon:yes gene_type:complete
MAFKYSKGNRTFGDITAEGDSQGDTLIDFEEDQIDFHTSGSMRMQIANSVITTTVPIHISGSEIQGLRLAKGGSDYREIVFETDGVDTANISISNAENLVIQNETNGKDIQFWVNPTAGSNVQAMTIKESAKIGIGVDPSHKLDIDGDIRVRGNDIRDNSGNPAISFDGSANTTIAGNFSTSGGYIAQLDVVSSTPFAVTAAHHYLAVDTSAARTINLPAISSGDIGRILTIFDAAGNADNQNITINVGDGGEDISGGGNYVINTPGGVVTIICAAADAWVVINKIT